MQVLNGAIAAALFNLLYDLVLSQKVKWYAMCPVVDFMNHNSSIQVSSSPSTLGLKHPHSPPRHPCPLSTPALLPSASGLAPWGHVSAELSVQPGAAGRQAPQRRWGCGFYRARSQSACCVAEQRGV